MTQRVDVFYSFRSPYCYLLTPRLNALGTRFAVDVAIRPVYPIAVRDAGFFRRVDPLYRPYHLQDSARLAEWLGLPYRRPVPDPIVQDLATSEIAADQPYIRHITRMAQAAAAASDGLAYATAVMTLLWDGATDNWHEGGRLADAVDGAGLDFAALDRRAAGQWGVPLMVFDGEPFYGQDRFDLLCWRLTQRGLAKSDGE
jgi:2-hydroxychromene-2-carboxylate isomerase